MTRLRVARKAKCRTILHIARSRYLKNIWRSPHGVDIQDDQVESPHGVDILKNIWRSKGNGLNTWNYTEYLAIDRP